MQHVRDATACDCCLEMANGLLCVVALVCAREGLRKVRVCQRRGWMQPDCLAQHCSSPTVLLGVKQLFRAFQADGERTRQMVVHAVLHRRWTSRGPRCNPHFSAAPARVPGSNARGRRPTSSLDRRKTHAEQALFPTCTCTYFQRGAAIDILNRETVRRLTARLHGCVRRAAKPLLSGYVRCVCACRWLGRSLSSSYNKFTVVLFLKQTPLPLVYKP